MLEWAKSTEDYHFAAINRNSFYRITENCLSHTWELDECTENKPYHKTKKWGTYATLDDAKRKADKLEFRAKRKPDVEVSK